MIDRRSILLPATGVDVRKLAIGAREAYILTQLDGQLTLEEIADLTGVDVDAAVAMGEKLALVGAATVKGAPTRRRSQKSLRMARVSPPPPPPKASTRPPPKRASVRPEACDLGESMQKAIVELDAKVLFVDHYARLGVERGADKRAIKRAYFGIASKFHPDRFFGKKLGPLKAAVDRVFRLCTEAHDTLVDVELRKKYDATLPKLSKPPATVGVGARPSKAPRPKTSRPPARASRAPGPRSSTSRKMKRVSLGATADAAATAMPIIVPPPPAMPNPIPAQSPTLTADRIKSLLAGAREVRSKERADLLVKAAEESMAKGDVIGASNNYRLALEHRDDPFVRAKLDDVERLAKAVRFERHVTRAQNAEREKQWADAASLYEHALECKRDAAVAERAAAAYHLGGTDLERALELAALAVTMRGNQVDYRITFAEILYDAGQHDRAKEQSEKALEIAPKDPRAKELAKVLAKKRG